MTTKIPPCVRIAWTDEEARLKPRRRIRIPVRAIVFGLMTACIPGSVFVYCSTLIEHDPVVMADAEVSLPSNEILALSASLMEKIASVADVETVYLDSNSRLSDALQQRAEATTTETDTPVQVATLPIQAPTSSVSAINRLMSVGRENDPSSDLGMAMSFAPSESSRSGGWLRSAQAAATETDGGEADAGLLTATVHRPVNFRVSPGKGRVMRVLPRGTVAELHDPTCKSWCEVTALGETGYVSGDFLRR